jgi:hypothetical protein
VADYPAQSRTPHRPGFGRGSALQIRPELSGLLMDVGALALAVEDHDEFGGFVQGAE